jgi:mannose-6-phosphate isomerase-like protein (cupin superfamily)
MLLKDYQNEPHVTNLIEDTKENQEYRTAIWTGKRCQCTLMTIPVGSDIGIEIHKAHDQFLYIEHGIGTAQLGTEENELNETQVQKGSAIFVPFGTWHNVVNSGTEPLRLFSIYAPVMHKPGTVHHKKEDGYKKFA